MSDLLECLNDHLTHKFKFLERLTVPFMDIITGTWEALLSNYVGPRVIDHRAIRRPMPHSFCSWGCVSMSRPDVAKLDGRGKIGALASLLAHGRPTASACLAA